jgi:hypothetical protein
MELRCGEVLLMMFLARAEKGWNCGSTRTNTTAESEITSVVFWSGRAQKEKEKWVKKRQ